MSFISELIKEFRFSISHRKELMPAQKALDAKAPRVGDMAPDFTLHDIEGKGPVTLSEFRGKRPVALVFGSFT